jgi:hypothetical protein
MGSREAFLRTGWLLFSAIVSVETNFTENLQIHMYKVIYNGFADKDLTVSRQVVKRS